MPRKKIVKDKLYYVSERMGVSKSDLPYIFDVSMTSLRNWSYNPENVSEELRNKIEDIFLLLDVCHVQIKPVKNIEDYSWNVRIASSSYLLSNVHLGYFLRRELLFRMDCVTRMAPLRKESLRLNGEFCKIAFDKRLELPKGVLTWDDKLVESKGE